ncbi:MAG: biotin/lipoyl-binding protein [Gammaproteobacteria bacterium]|nr:biotin/lipoyl-binding protein [Gammaproteobacteria bacterium]
MPVFTKLLVANRGEIAARVMRTAKKMGYRTVAVYSDADANAFHVTQADEAVHIGPSAVGQSYLNIAAIIAAAKKAGADAIHPGYGFLSENAAFAQACADNHILFIGPTARAIELMGSKRQSKIAVQKHNVPTIPGYDGEDQALDTLKKEAARIGTPLMIKASAGGGGRGMRLISDLGELDAALKSARSEAENAFGSGELILEKAVINPRHVEIQIFGDTHGNIVHLGERDCSIQRRHQKVVEEAPSPAVNAELRARMGAAAVSVAKLVDYVGAGTVEFLLDTSGDFYFLEMNTRLQVEHPVTELVTGQDLVEWQLRVATGEPLPLQQHEIELRGHAIEVRLYAEDPAQNYLPQTGPVHFWHWEDLPGTRADHGIRVGSDISPFYDSMLAKMIASAPDRTTAIRKLDRLLENTVLLGTTTNKHFLRQLITQPSFMEGGATTAFISQHQQALVPPPAFTPAIAALAAALWTRHHSQPGAPNPHRTTPVLLQIGDKPLHLDVITDAGQTCQVKGPDFAVELQLLEQGHNRVTALIDGIRRNGWFHIEGKQLWLDCAGQTLSANIVTHAPVRKADAAGSGRIVAPMDGNVVAVLVEQGQQVSKGATLAILEAMKMEHPLRADIDGTVDSILVTKGTQLKSRQVMILLKPEAK